MNPDGVHDPGQTQHGEPCFEDGHLPGCAGTAGGDHLVPDDWFEDEEGYLRAPLSYERPEPYPHAYFHPGPQDCRDYAQCHARAYGEAVTS